MPDYNILRKKMVDEQLKKRGINSPDVIKAFNKVPREEFVPEKSKNMAYQDAPLPIGLGQTISQPYIVAVMTQALQVDKNSKVLEVGSGSGYQAAILAEIVKEVYSIERISKLAEFAKNNLKRLKCDNVSIIEADGTLGYKPEALYNGIIVTAGTPKVPVSLKEQLEIGGCLVIPVGDSYSQVLKKIKKTKDGFKEEEICSCVFVPLIGKEGWGDK